jgi:anti-sigma B factor antagonist
VINRRVESVELVVDRSSASLLVNGDIDADDGDALLSAMGDALSHSPARVFVDLGGVTFIDSSGLVALLSIKQLATADGIPFVLVDPSPVVRRLLESTGLDGTFRIG